MRDDDLAPFAVAEGLLAKMSPGDGWRLTEPERDHLLERARDNHAKGSGRDPAEAAQAMKQAFDLGHFTIQAGPQFAVVTMYGRVLIVMTRHALRGRCHPERN